MVRRGRQPDQRFGRYASLRISIDRPVAFAVVPKGTSATITVGNTQNILGADAPGRVVPAGFTNKTYIAPAVGGNGGVRVLVLDRHTLQLVSSNTYSSTSQFGNGDAASTQALLNDVYNQDNSKLVFNTTLVASPNQWVVNTEINQGNQYRNLLQAINQMGVSPYAFDKAMGQQWGLNNPASAFSMIGVPRNFFTDFPSVVKSGSAACPMAPLVCGANKDQWFSCALDTQQHETGALTGSLVRNNLNQYYPADVHPFDVSKLGDNPTADDLLADNIARAVGSAATVAWPLTDTPGHKAAYASLSYKKLSKDFYGGEGLHRRRLLQRHPLLLHRQSGI